MHRVARAAIVLGVPLSVLVWGGTYLGACYKVLEAPGASISHIVKGKRGDIVLTAKRYRFDLQAKTFALAGVTARSTRGGINLNLGSVVVKDVGSLPFGKPRLVVDAADLSGDIVRFEDGTFEFDDLISPSTEPGEPMPMELHLSRIGLSYVDLGSKQSRSVTMPQLNAFVLGEDWMLSGDPKIQGLGDLGVSVRMKPAGGIAVALDASQPIDGAELLAELRTWLPKDQLPAISVEGMTLTGNMEAVLEAKRPWHFTGAMAARAKSFRLDRGLIENADVTAFGDESGLQLAATARIGSAPSQLSGFLDLATFRFDGQGEMSVANRRALPAWATEALPKGIDWEAGKYTGWLTWMGGTDVHTAGQFVARSVSSDQDTLTQPRVLLGYRPGLVRAELLGGSWRSVPMRGEVAVEGVNQSLSGWLRAEKVPVATVASRIGLKGWQGAGRAEMVLSGTTAKPLLYGRLTGAASRPRQDFAIPGIGFDIVAEGDTSRIRVRRGLLQTAQGGASVTGDWTAQKGLDLRAEIRGLDFLALQQRVEGQANLSLKVTGPIDRPRAVGRVEGYDVSIDDFRFPVASAELVATRDAVRLDRIRVVRGPALVEGRVSWTPKTNGFAGRFRADKIQLAEFLGEDVLGFVSAPEIVLSGTLEAPLGSGRLQSSGILMHGIRVDSATADLRLVGSQIAAEGVVVKLADGTLQGRGDLDIATQHGTFSAFWDSISLTELFPEASQQVTLAGQFGGTASGAIAGKKLQSVQAHGTLAALNLNRTDFGSGSWSLDGEQDLLKVSFSLGTLDRYLAGTDLTFSLSSEEIGGLLEVYNFDLQDLLSSAGRSVEALPDATRLRLSELEGMVNAGITLGGDLEDPKIDAKNLTVAGIRLSEVEIGDLSLVGSYVADSFDLASLTLTGPNGSASMQGRLGKDRSVTLDGEVRGLKMAALRAFDPGYTGLTGALDELTFIVGGTTTTPELRASAKFSGLLAKSPDAPDDETLRILIDSADVDPKERTDRSTYSELSAIGRFFFRGFQGDLTATVPFDLASDKTVPDSRVRLGLARRDLKEIATLIEGFDPERTEGGVEGEVVMRGPLSALGLSGNIKVNAAKLAQKGLDSTLTGAAFGIDFAGEEISVTASATGSRGGSLNGKVSTKIDGLQDLASLLRPGRLDELFDNPLTGQLSLSGLQARQKFTGNAYADAAMTGSLNVSGPIRAPKVSGDLAFAGVDSILPMFESQAGVAPTFAINPSFDVKFRATTPARVRTTGAELFLTGDGVIGGTLEALTLNSTLLLQSGTLQLPNHKVRLEEGGTIRATFDMNPAATSALLDVNLEGRTSLTARRQSDQIERYDIQLRVRGDLLREGDLTLTAESDPPDLTQAQILSYLGQTQLLESIGGSVSAGETERRIRDALAGYAIPTVFESLTTNLAKGLRLDYLSLEYNPYDLATVVFSQRLGSGWTFVGRRQIGEPPPGFLARYEYKLQYRPSRSRLLNRVSFMIGADQDRPIKTALEYSIRF